MPQNIVVEIIARAVRRFAARWRDHGYSTILPELGRRTISGHVYRPFWEIPFTVYSNSFGSTIQFINVRHQFYYVACVDSFIRSIVRSYVACRDSNKQCTGAHAVYRVRGHL
jgi:hypothetical protein